jgi:serine/threonine protein kinase
VEEICGRKLTLSKEGTFLNTAEIRHATSHILSGVAYLHSMGIVHRDIKGGNIYLVPQHDTVVDAPRDEVVNPLTNYTLKLGDFGLAVRMEEDDDWDECLMTVCGTPSCLAPEVIKGGGNTPNENTQQSSSQSQEIDQQMRYGQPADLWSTGCLLYTMIVGRSPFALPAANKHQTEHEKMARVAATMQRVSNEDWSVPTYISMSSEMDNLLNQLLESSPRKRGTGKEILQFHPFFTDQCFEEGSNRLKPVHETILIEKSTTDSGIRQPADGKENTPAVDTSHRSIKQQEINPMEGIARLPLNKYEWKTGHRHFTACLLGHDGLVIMEKSINHGRWLHVTSDGQLTLHDQSSPAFKCDPQNLRNYIRHEFNDLDLAHHVHISSLLQPSNKRYLRLYKSLERLIQSVRSSTPKIILYLQSQNALTTNQNSSSRVFAKVLLMENGPNADIEATFVEGLSFRIRNIGPKSSQMIVRSDNAEELTLDFHTEELLECKLERLLSAQRQFILSRSRTTVEMLSQHFNIVQTALIECLRIEKTFRNKKNSFPMTVKMIADGTDRSKWIILNDALDCQTSSIR